jgi:citrate lyase subunit beta/citryl-CoA lyase
MKHTDDSMRIREAAGRQSRLLLEQYRTRRIDLEPKYLLQMAHLTVPATVWKYVEKAVTRSPANLVMLDLEDSIPRDDDDLLELGRNNIIRALEHLDWGPRLRFFRPRGIELDPAQDDIVTIVGRAGANLDGLVYPKAETAREIEGLDQTLSLVEESAGLTRGKIKVEILIESAAAVEEVFDIACASRRLAGLIFGSYDYWASLGLGPVSYRADHALLNYARIRIVQAAASVGVPAIAEMTTNYPTRDKSDEHRARALDEFRRDSQLALSFGFAGKWTGIPEQTALAAELFRVGDDEISAAISEARAFLQVERAGRGATMMDGKMIDRATDRVNRNVLKTAYALGLLDKELAIELGIE